MILNSDTGKLQTAPPKTGKYIRLLFHVDAHTLEKDPVMASGTGHPSIVFVEGGKNPSQVNLFLGKSLCISGI